MLRPTRRDVAGWIVVGVLLALFALAAPRFRFDAGWVLGLVVPGAVFVAGSLIQSRRSGRSWVVSAARGVFDLCVLVAVALAYAAFSARFGRVPIDPFDSSIDSVGWVLFAIFLLVAWIEVARYFEIGLFGRRLKPPLT